MQAVHNTAQRSKWLLLLLSMLLNAVSTQWVRGAEIVTKGVGRTADYVFQFRICRLHYVVRLSDGFSAAFLVVRALSFLISHCLSLCTALCVCVCLAGHGRVCIGALTSAKLLPSFLAVLLLSLVRSLFSVF